MNAWLISHSLVRYQPILLHRNAGFALIGAAAAGLRQKTGRTVLCGRQKHVRAADLLPRKGLPPQGMPHFQQFSFRLSVHYVSVAGLFPDYFCS
jgi:hypothetical protein